MYGNGWLEIVFDMCDTAVYLSNTKALGYFPGAFFIG